MHLGHLGVAAAHAGSRRSARPARWRDEDSQLPVRLRPEFAQRTPHKAEASFIGSVKPNKPKVANVFEASLVLGQPKLSGAFGTEKIRQSELRPMYASLPKNEHGTLEPPAVCYAFGSISSISIGGM